jgi:hypothetical protein
MGMLCALVLTMVLGPDGALAVLSWAAQPSSNSNVTIV